MEVIQKKFIMEKAIEFMHEPGKPGFRKMEVTRGERVAGSKVIPKERVIKNMEYNYNKAVAQEASLQSRPSQTS